MFYGISDSFFLFEFAKISLKFANNDNKIAIK